MVLLGFISFAEIEEIIYKFSYRKIYAFNFELIEYYGYSIFYLIKNFNYLNLKYIIKSISIISDPAHFIS